ncbi:hypothetical protein PBY51_021683 [Eleginops maclovinus]|uniref:Uncharacterized protein n=1 Tax=Eleginops maclovinus TaxID=56733 RepID=A0AAN8AHL2_ELEMC|nr:hypothetical protein PBY51_021683 [Eleginops maclovinus]
MTSGYRRPVSVPSGHAPRDGTESAATRGSIPHSKGWARTTRGVLGGLASRLWTHTSVQTSHLTTSKGPSLGPYMDMQATVVLMCAESLMLGVSVESCIRDPPPPLVRTTCCLKDNITPCKQAADRLQVLGQEQSGGGITVFIRV